MQCALRDPREIALPRGAFAVTREVSTPPRETEERDEVSAEIVPRCRSGGQRHQPLVHVASGDVSDVRLEIGSEPPEPPRCIVDVGHAESVRLLGLNELLDDLRDGADHVRSHRVVEKELDRLRERTRLAEPLDRARIFARRDMDRSLFPKPSLRLARLGRLGRGNARSIHAPGGEFLRLRFGEPDRAFLIGEVPEKTPLADHPRHGEHGLAAVDFNCDGACLGVLNRRLVGCKSCHAAVMHVNRSCVSA